MANDVTPTRAGSVTRSRIFDKLRGINDALSAGVAISFPILSIGPNQWTVRFRGEERIITVPGHDNINQPFVDVVILDVQKDMSRVFYKDPYGGQRNRPDCWSSNGIKPDAEVANPINPICATCHNAAWGSGATPAAPKAQACQQRRRTVLVPYGDDLTNAEEGGPMLLSVPPGSLKPSMSHGFFALPPALIQSFAAFTRSAGGTIASMSFIAFARSTLIWSPLRRNCSASAGASMRAMRVVPPAPGNRPTLISGSPRRVCGFCDAMRWWQASASSKPPPTAVPLSAATDGLPQVSIRR